MHSNADSNGITEKQIKKYLATNTVLRVLQQKQPTFINDHH